MLLYPVVRILSPESSGSIVLQESGIPVYVAAYSDSLSSVTISVKLDGTTILAETNCVLLKTFASRLPLDCYTYNIPRNLLYADGMLEFTATAYSSQGYSSDTVTARIVPQLQYTYTVSDDGELADALNSIRDKLTGDFKHVKILLSAGDYNWPVGIDYEIDDARELVVIDGQDKTAKIYELSPIIYRARWEGVEFCGTTVETDVVTISNRGSPSHHFYGCEFHNSSGMPTFNVTGVKADTGSYVSIDNCYFYDLATCTAGATSVRFSFWRDLGGPAFKDISRVLEGNVGKAITVPDTYEGKQSAFWLHIGEFSNGLWENLIIRYNLVLRCDDTIVYSDGQYFNKLCLVGNVFNGTGSYGIHLRTKGLKNLYMVNNTLSSGALHLLPWQDGMTISGTSVLNNYFQSDLTNVSIWGEEVNEYDYNASAGAIEGENSLSSISPNFDTNYNLLKSNSPLIGKATSIQGITNPFGILPQSNQMGAMPYISTGTDRSKVLGIFVKSPLHGCDIQ